MKYFLIIITFFNLLFFNSFVLAQTALFIFAHPDDELTANGAILHLVNKGMDVHVAYSTSGKYGRDVRGIIKKNPKRLAQQREKEAIDALAVIGVQAKNIHLLKMDDYSTDVYRMAEPLLQLFNTVKPKLVITFGPDGLYGHVDHRSLPPIVSYLFNNSKDSMVLLYVALSETKDEGYNYTHGKGSPQQGYKITHRVADAAINYQLDTSTYSDYQKKSLSKYVSQFSVDKRTMLSKFYDNALCPGTILKSKCEQFIIARSKPRFDHHSWLGLLGFKVPSN